MLNNTATHTNNGEVTIENIEKRLIVEGRDILNELDNLHKSMLLLPRDQKLQDKYPELKEAYDAYQELYRGVMIAEKMVNT